jgi:nucleoside 2-deoxyribosyltransferase
MKQKVYLAGGFYGDIRGVNWQQYIKDKFGDHFIFLDPRQKEFSEENKRMTFEEYTAWDLWAIRTADIVFVYSQRTNPGQGYIVEAGYAKGLGKTVILVREEDNEHMPDKYLNFIDCVSDYVCHDIFEGLEYFSRFSV